MKTASFFTYQGPGRISIARWAPDRIAPGYARFAGLAPPRAWHRLDRIAFAHRYLALLEAFNPGDLWAELHNLADGAEPILQCWETPKQIRDGVPGKDACHRHIVAAWFEARLGIRVAELGADGDDFLDPRVCDLVRVVAEQDSSNNQEMGTTNSSDSSSHN